MCVEVHTDSNLATHMSEKLGHQTRHQKDDGSSKTLRNATDEIKMGLVKPFGKNRFKT